MTRGVMKMNCPALIRVRVTLGLLIFWPGGWWWGSFQKIQQRVSCVLLRIKYCDMLTTINEFRTYCSFTLANTLEKSYYRAFYKFFKDIWNQISLRKDPVTHGHTAHFDQRFNRMPCQIQIKVLELCIITSLIPSWYSNLFNKKVCRVFENI